MGVQLEVGGGRSRGAKPNINVTPLVDVVLVLLIIFMVVLPDMNDDGKPIDLVQVTTGEEPKDASSQIVVTLDRDGKYSIDEVELSRVEIVERIRASHERRGTVVLRADSALPYRDVRGFLAEVQETGFRGLQLAVGSRRQWGPEGGP